MKKGFTLVELLAVIVILSIIAVITIPMIKGVIDKVKLGSLEDSVYGLKSAAELYFSSNGKLETTEFICSDNGCISNTGKKLEYKGKVEGKVKLFSDGKVSICLTDDNYASSILASEKKATTKMGGCDEETYEISEVIAIEKYNEIKNDLDSVNNDFLSVKNTLYNKKIITDINNETQLINSDITNYSTGVNNLVDSLYNKTIISSKENTFEQMASEVDDLDLNQGEAANKKAIVDGLKYSGLGITEDMTWEEIKEKLLETYPELPIGTTYNFGYTGGVQTWTSRARGLYKIEVYGAQGGNGNSGYPGGKGGYSVGYKFCEKGEVLYIYVGQVGETRYQSDNRYGRSSYNGGGRPLSYNNGYSGGGGGATHIATKGRGELSSYNSFRDELIVVAGGGGGGSINSAGGTGGGTTGGSGCAAGGTQTSGGNGFGQGAFVASGKNSSGGGGGFYGGNAGDGCGSGGGSGYIGGSPDITYKGTTYKASTGNGSNSGNGKAVITYIAS